MGISILTDDCLLYLLALFPLDIQIKLRAVCPRWKFLIEKKLLHKVKTVEIYSKKNGMLKVDLSFIKIILKSDAAKSLLTNSHFTQVNSLTFRVVGSPSKSHLAHYLAQWPSSLTVLNLKFTSKCSANTQCQIWNQINSMKSLKELMLTFSDNSSWKVPKKLPILSNLEKFVLSNYGKDEIPVLDQLGPNLQELILTEVCGTGDCLRAFTRTLEFVGEKLLSLRSLDIEINYCPMTYLFDLFTKLANLKQLTTLGLGPFDWKQLKSLYAYSVDSLPRLVSVKELCLCGLKLGGKPDEDTDCLTDFYNYFFPAMPTIFPSLECLNITFDAGKWDRMRRGIDENQYIQLEEDMKADFPLLREIEMVE